MALKLLKGLLILDRSAALPSAPIFRPPWQLVQWHPEAPRRAAAASSTFLVSGGAFLLPPSSSFFLPSCECECALICGGRSCCYTGENSFPLTGDGDGGRMAGTGAGERAGRRRTDRGSGTRKMAAQGRTDCPESNSAMQCSALQLIYRQ